MISQELTKPTELEHYIDALSLVINIFWNTLSTVVDPEGAKGEDFLQSGRNNEKNDKF